MSVRVATFKTRHRRTAPILAGEIDRHRWATGHRQPELATLSQSDHPAGQRPLAPALFRRRDLFRRPSRRSAPDALPRRRARHPQSPPGLLLRTGRFRPAIALSRPGGGARPRAHRSAGGPAAARTPAPSTGRPTHPPPDPRRAEPPARSAGESGPALGDVARHTGLTEERVV